MALIHHWPLNDNAASTTVVATVGTNGTLLGGDNTSDKTTAGPGGSITAGLIFNGTDDAVDISASSISLAAGATKSISFWFKCATTASVDTAIGANGTSDSAVRLTNDTTIAVRDTSAVSFTVPSLGTTWHHCLVTWTAGNSVKLYLDGVASASNPQSLTGTFAPNRIARGGAFSDISVAQVKIFDSDESANVASLYAEGVAALVQGGRLHSTKLFRRSKVR